MTKIQLVSPKRMWSSRLTLSALSLLIGASSLAHAQSTPFPLGLFPNPNSPGSAADAQFQTDYNSFTSLMGAAPQFINYYLNYSDAITTGGSNTWDSDSGWASWVAQQSSLAKSAIPVIGMPLASNGSGAPSPDQQFQAFTSGKYDQAIQAVVSNWQKNGFNTQYYRPGWEMNLETMTWFPGDRASGVADPVLQADLVAAYQHVVDVLRQAGADNGVTIKIIWNPGAKNYDTVDTTTKLYPGNAYVDIIGVDLYADAYPFLEPNGLYWDWSSKTTEGLSQWVLNPANRTHYYNYPAATQYSLDGSGNHNLYLQQLLAFAKAQGKPFAVPETGAGNSNGGHDAIDNPEFPQWLSQTLTASGVPVAFVGIWDSNADGNYEFSLPGDNKPNEAAAWAAGFSVQGISSTSWYTVANQNSNLCLDAAGWGTADGTRLIQWTCGNRQFNQEWQFRPTDSGYYRIVSRNAQGEQLDAVASGKVNGTRVQLFSQTGLPNQQWLPVALGNGSYKLVERDSGLCLDVPGASTALAVQLQLYVCNGTGAQGFHLNVQP